MIVDDAQMRMPRPGIDNLLVEFTCETEPLFIRLFIASGIGGRGIVLKMVGTSGTLNTL